MKNIKSKINILCIADYFYPGHLAGGPITTLINMRQQLKDWVTLSVFTRDRDLGCGFQYSNILINQWTSAAEGPIYYASPEKFNSKGVLAAFSADKFDLIYLNSFFSLRASIAPLIALRKLKPNVRVLLAPRGELSLGALSIKRQRKFLFLKFVRMLGLYKTIFWHASTTLEAADIARIFPTSRGRIFIAADPVVIESIHACNATRVSENNFLRIAFISRISPQKNLDGLLRILYSVSLGVRLDIFGPIEDEAHWKKCLNLIKSLPKNIQVKMQGPIAQNLVTATFAGYDLFAFPTHGENFGHVIFESLRAGTPVIVSDQTPWKEDEAGALTVIPIADTDGWRKTIEKAASSTFSERQRTRNAARAYAIRYVAEENTQKENLELFYKVLNH